MTRRHFFLALCFLLSAAAAAACAPGKERGQEIANLVYIPSTAPVGEGRTQTVIGTFNIIHPGADTASVNTVVLDAQGNKIGETAVALDDAALRTADTLAFGTEIGTSAQGVYTFRVYTVDGKGRQSNRLTGTLAVTGLF